jgi:hypothetical protein
MLRRDSWSATQLVREGIVTQSTVRFAASASLIAASLLMVGPNPAQAVADKHGPGSYSKNDARKNGANRKADNPPRRISDFVNGAVHSGDFDGNSRLDLIPPPMALRSAAVAEQPVGVIASDATAARAGSDFAAPSAATIRSPRVVIGNGRTPGMHVPTTAGRLHEIRDSALQSTAAAESVPAVPQAIEINIPPLPPIERIQPAAPLVGELSSAELDTTTDPLAGLAGLILLPAIGAALGFRQARAAQSLRESTRT